MRHDSYSEWLEQREKRRRFGYACGFLAGILILMFAGYGLLCFFLVMLAR